MGDGDGPNGTSHREVGGFSVRYVERGFQEELGNLADFIPWMNIHFAMWDDDLESYAARLLGHGVAVLVLRWPAAGPGGHHIFIR
jgi:hypothetical protein